MNRQELSELIDKYLTGKASKEETDRFFYLIEQPEYADEFHGLLEEQYRQGLFDTEPNKKLRQLVQARLRAAINQETPERRRAVVRTMPWKWVAAAVVVLVAGGLWLWQMQNAKFKMQSPSGAVVAYDVKAPERARAVITLADGRKVFLDSAGNGLLAQQEGVKVVRNERGEIVYETAIGNRQSAIVVYNSLYNPRGSKVISLTLSDGTRVWLNSESSLRYPAVFSGDKREVEITGEAYFEVAKIPRPSGTPLQGGMALPFIVKKGDMQVTVLGTHFNVNAYEDEEDIKVTLLEGSVKVSNRGSIAILKPGEQAAAIINNKLSIIKPDLEQVMSWKNGQFVFKNAGLREIMREASRWYNVQVLYEGSVSAERYEGEVSRATNLSELMKILALGGVKYTIEGDKVRIF